ncbi:hypothetical protein QLQ12_19635 [Actinoplanes sp. NEAU-A12]|uniref:HEAT repeat protein n=1 Tax=Actinoplanes sandaracinus TaxID=3045177 RepID=A0ABT6WM79_9ACTN|nr:hypothetical protein [Actinoplanes sandaracinus]MDI6100827.1 hypothetical protein [Actinoplanes sandaracinus]
MSRVEKKGGGGARPGRMLGVIASTRRLLAVLDPLPYPRRLDHVAAWARTAPDRAAVCADLWREGAYERHLALIAAAVIGDVEAVTAATRDPVPGLRSVALEAAVRAGLPVGDVGDLAAVDRRRIYRVLRRLRRPAVADALIIEVLAAHGPAEAAALLPGCSAETVRTMLPDLEHVVNLSAVARTHQDVVHDRVRERLAAAKPEHRSLVWSPATAAAVLNGDPAVLDLLDRFAPEDQLPGPLSAYRRLAAHHPDRVAALLTAPGRAAWLRRQTLPRTLLRRLAALPDDRLVPLARAVRDHAQALAGLLAALPPARRGGLYDAALADVDTATRIPPSRVMDVLPAAVRFREAARVLALPAVREHESQVREWSAYLPWPEASAALEPAIRSGDATVRAAGWSLLVAAALRTRATGPVAEVTGRLVGLRNEQDPVRSAALEALAGAGRLLTAAATPDLTRIATDAAEARDASYATTYALGRLAGEVLRHHAGVPELAEWALSTFHRLNDRFLPPALALRRGQEVEVFDRLRPGVEAAARRGAHGLLFTLARAFGRRAHHIPALQEMLRRSFAPNVLESTARTAIGLWLDDPRTRSERVAEVLAADPTAVAVPVVWRTVCTNRTDLLDVVFARRPRGRFVEEGLRWVPSGVERAERWLPRQQRRLVDLMERVVEDAEVPQHHRASALRVAARVPGAGRELALRFAGAPEVMLAEAALGALVWTDRPDEALPVLLAHAGGGRARVALYAADRAVRFVPPARLPGLIGPVLAGPSKITSRKEAVRLLAHYGPASAMATLLAAYRTDGQHRDVRAAIVSAARQHLENEVSWLILDQAGGGSREEHQAVLDARPDLVPVAHRARYAGLILAACRGQDREIRRTAFLRLASWAPWAGDVTGLVVDRLTDLDVDLDVHAAGQLIPAAGPGWFDDAYGRLAARDAAETRPAGPGSDRPAVRRVDTLARAVPTIASTVARARSIPEIRRLAGRPGHLAVAVPVLVALGRLDNLDEVADLCAGRPVLAVRAADQAGDRLRQLPQLVDADTLRPVITRLAGRGDLAGGLLAVALTASGDAFGWASPWRELLLALREHPVPDVRDEAFAVDMT